MAASPRESHIGLVVEGAGEVQAVPLLIRLYLQSIGESRDLIGKPVACHGRDKALRKGGLEGKVAVAAARPGCGAVLVVLDGEGDRTCELGPSLLTRARTVSGIPVEIAIAEDSYEDWLIASADTLNLPGIAFGAGGGVVQIKKALRPAKYVKPTWQPRLTARMDIAIARKHSTSFDRLLNKLDLLISEIGLGRKEARTRSPEG